MKRFWTRLLRNETPTKRRWHGRSLRIEQFEERRVMDGSFAGLDQFIQGAAANIHVVSSPVELYDDGTLVISGTDSSDDVRVTAGGNTVYVIYNDQTFSFERTTQFTHHATAANGFLLGPPVTVDLANVTRIEFYGAAGHDRIQNDTDLPTYAEGGTGNDFLIGGSAADRLVGGDGDDSLLGREGADTLLGGAGVDRIQGNEGRDTLRGGANNDELFGGTDDDKLSGDAGNDALYGGQGVDTLWGGAGHDDLAGGEGFDDLVGGAGVDWFEPGPDNVWIDDPETGYVLYDGSTKMVTIDDNKSPTNLVPHNDNMAGVTAFLDLNNAWAMSLEATRQRILDRLAEARPAGQSLYDVSLSLPSQGFQEIAQDEWGTHLRLTLPGAYLEATSTQPTILGKWADPRFGLSFDITVDVHLAPTGGLRVTSTVASISNAQIHSVNVVSDVLDFFNSLVDDFTGVNFKSLAEAEINGTEFKNAIDTSATKFVNTLAPGASVVYDVDSGVVLLRTRRQSPPIDINNVTWQPGRVTDAVMDAGFIKPGTGAATTLDRDGLELAYQSPWSDLFDDMRFSESYSSPSPRGDLEPFSSVDVASDFDWAMLSPQPLPPKDMYFGDLSSDLDMVALNPQPLPPHESILSDASFGSDFDWELLNPQPLPPQEEFFADLATELDLVALNPQPLPPREDFSTGVDSSLDMVALNPQPLPPKESYVDSFEFGSTFDAVMLYPQPLPPKNINQYAATVIGYTRLPSARLFAW